MYILLFSNLHLRGDGVQANKIAVLALLLDSATLDPSPENQARANIAAIKGLTAADITEAQTLSGEMGSGKSVLLPIDQYLEPVAKAGDQK